MSKPNKARGGRRGTPRRRPRTPLVLVLCQGEKTETDYLDLLKQHYRLKVSIQAKPLDPVKLSQEAASIAKHDGNWDEIYVLVDVDDSSHHQIERAVSICRRAKHAEVRLVVSNPCFEFWLLLHTDYHPVPGLTTPDAQRAAITRKLLVGRDHKMIAPGFPVGEHKQATERWDKLGFNQMGAAPSTAMPDLVERLLKLQPGHLT